MIPEAKAVKLIKIYFYICERYEEELKYCCERFSNNARPELTDQEIMTIYLYTIKEEQRFKVKQIHRFANEYLRSWFPNLGSYAAFNNRLNRLSEAFKQLVVPLLNEFQPKDCCLGQSLLDSMPIITCSGRRSPKVATELEREKGSVMLTPVKAVKGQTEVEKQWNKAADDLFSRAVSKVRQPIEGLFNWLIEKTDFQKASKVRSTKGLLVHVFGKIAAAFIYLIF